MNSGARLQPAMNPDPPIAEIAGRLSRAGAVWGARSAGDRVRFARKLQRAIAARQEDILAAIVADTGKPVTEAASQEVTAALGMLRHMERKYPRWLRPQGIRTRAPGFWTKSSFVAFEPLGIIAIIGPSNFPFSLPLMQIAASLLCGNAVICKPSDHAPRSSAILRDLFSSCGLPEGLVAIVEGGDDVATEVIAMERVRKVIFTGSSAGGRAVARLCGEHFKPCVLELGGSGAAIVCDDADIALAARGIAWSAFAARGGSCVGTKRVFVHEAIAGAFAAALEHELLRLRPGDPADPASDLPFPVERQDTERLRAIVANAFAEGGTIFTPGGRVRAAEDLDARLPVVIFDAHTHMRAMREEAPVLAVRTVRTIDQAVRETNESCFGLSASVWSREGSVAREIARQLYTGIVWINDASAGEPGYPWGGVKSSGWGRIFGRAGIAELTNVKVVSQDRRHSSTPKFWWFPYSREKLELLQEVNAVLYGRRWRRLPHLLSAVWRYLAGRWTAGKGADKEEGGGLKNA